MHSYAYFSVVLSCLTWAAALPHQNAAGPRHKTIYWMGDFYALPSSIDASIIPRNAMTGVPAEYGMEEVVTVVALHPAATIATTTTLPDPSSTGWPFALSDEEKEVFISVVHARSSPTNTSTPPEPTQVASLVKEITLPASYEAKGGRFGKFGGKGKGKGKSNSGGKEKAKGKGKSKPAVIVASTGSKSTPKPALVGWSPIFIGLMFLCALF